MIIDLDQLEDRAAYCVIRDESNRESIVASGSAIKTRAENNPDFKRFGEREIISLPGYVRVRVNDGCFLGVWLDPWRPELQGGYTTQPAPFQVKTVNATVKEFIKIRDILVSCTDLELCLRSRS